MYTPYQPLVANRIPASWHLMGWRRYRNDSQPAARAPQDADALANVDHNPRMALVAEVDVS